jgi:DNA-binding NarL/FixJ family response regulator
MGTSPAETQVRLSQHWRMGNLLMRQEGLQCSGEVMDEAIRVLVVEDQPIVREAITAEFDRERGFDVRQAGSLADARALIGDVDIVITDLGLPDGDGASLIEQVTANSPMAQVLVLTSSIDPADAERALQRGADAVLNKLADLDQVLATVKHLL